MTAAATSPNALRPASEFVRYIADTLRRIEYNYAREGSGPGSRFEGRLLEDVQAETVVRLTREASAQLAEVQSRAPISVQSPVASQALREFAQMLRVPS